MFVVIQLVFRSLDSLVTRPLVRSDVRSPDRSISRYLDGPLDASLDGSVVRSVARSVARVVGGSILYLRVISLIKVRLMDDEVASFVSYD